jgi:hypothetical protein
VLLKAIEKHKKEPTEINAFILKLVLETCQQILFYYKDFATEASQKIVAFATRKDARTTDVLPSIQIMIAQLYTFHSIKNFQEKFFTDRNLTQDDLRVIFRYGFEEELRRNLMKTGMKNYTDVQALDYILPGWQAVIKEILDKQKVLIEEDF